MRNINWEPYNSSGHPGVLVWWLKRVFLAVTLCLSLGAFSQTPDSLDIKIGQMILIGFPKAEVDSAVLEEIRAGKVGSIIFFEKNIPKSNSFAGVKKITWTYERAARIPLLIAIDQEGGRVNRLKEKYGFTRSVSAAAMGKSKSLDTVRFYAEATAATLAGLGINVNFAPCVDLAINPDNTVIVKVERSYSADPDTVAMMAAEVVDAHRKHRVVTSLKHFPGHGSSREDTHFGVADVTRTWSERELKPYKTLLAGGQVDAVMTSHIVNKNLDPRGYPGTLSKRIIDSLLRKTLGFKGVVFSDDMQMQAITRQYGLEESIRLAILAGVDIMCFSNNIQGSEERTVSRVHKIIRKFVEDGSITRQRIDESFGRVMKLKMQLSVSVDEYFRIQSGHLRKAALEMQKNSQRAMMEAERARKEAEDRYSKLLEEQKNQSRKKKKK